MLNLISVKLLKLIQWTIDHGPLTIVSSFIFAGYLILKYVKMKEPYLNLVKIRFQKKALKYHSRTMVCCISSVVDGGWSVVYRLPSYPLTNNMINFCFPFALTCRMAIFTDISDNCKDF